MKKVYLTYSDESYMPARKLAVRMAKLFGGFDEVIGLSPDCIDNSFKAKNSKIFEYKRGAGLWLCKPYIVYKTLQKLNYGDFLFYADAG